MCRLMIMVKSLMDLFLRFSHWINVNALTLTNFKQEENKWEKTQTQTKPTNMAAFWTRWCMNEKWNRRSSRNNISKHKAYDWTKMKKKKMIKKSTRTQSQFRWKCWEWNKNKKHNTELKQNIGIMNVHQLDPFLSIILHWVCAIRERVQRA